MSKYLNSLNLVLVMLVGALCVFQWGQEKEFGRRIFDLSRTGSEQAAKIIEQTETIRQAGEDIGGFKSEIIAFKAQVDEQNAQTRKQKAQIFSLEGEKEKLTQQSAGLLQALDEYKKAVAARDENLKTLLDQREQLIVANKDAAGKANQAILAFNDLNAKYEDVVTRYNTLATRYKAEREAAAAQAAQSR